MNYYAVTNRIFSLLNICHYDAVLMNLFGYQYIKGKISSCPT